PLHMNVRFVAAIAVQRDKRHQWVNPEIELIRTIIVICWELVEREVVTQHLKNMADRLALSLAAARFGDWSWHAESDLMTFSARVAEIFGISGKFEMAWTQMQQLLHEGDREQVCFAMKHALANETQFDVEFRMMRPDGGEIW